MAAASTEPESGLAPSACRHCPLWHLLRGARHGTSMKSEFLRNGCGPKMRTPGADGRAHPLVAAFCRQADLRRTSLNRIRRRSPCDSSWPDSTSKPTRLARKTSGTSLGRPGIDSIAIPNTRATFLQSSETCEKRCRIDERQFSLRQLCNPHTLCDRKLGVADIVVHRARPLMGRPGSDVRSWLTVAGCDRRSLGAPDRHRAQRRTAPQN